MEQLKVGDIVRVSEDAPKSEVLFYDRIFTITDCIVDVILKDKAWIIYNGEALSFSCIVPTKYLVKVNAESKYIKGDKVIYKQTGKVKVVAKAVGDNRYYITTLDGLSPLRVNESEIEPYTEPKEPTIKVGDKVLAKRTDQITPSSETTTFRRNVSLVTKIKDGIASLYYVDEYGGNHYASTPIEFLKKVEETAEPKEPTERIHNMSDIIERKHLEHYKKVLSRLYLEKELSPTEHEVVTEPYFDWQRYEADLAAKIAVAYAEKGRYEPSEIGAYAVKVAKSVVENLKKREE